MPSERVQRQIDRLLDEAEAAVAQRDWALVREHCQDILRLDPENEDASAFLTAAERESAQPTDQPALGSVGARHAWPLQTPSTGQAPEPIAFANGRYQVKKFLGEGGKKKVYLAHDTLLDRDVAFALIKTEGLDDAGRLRIQREAQAMGRLGAHPHIVSVFDLGDEDGQPFIVTELMGGGDVEGVIEKAPDQRPPLERTLEIGQQVCRGLEFAHAHGIVHRDLKPGNVWLTADGTAKLGDFGLAVALDKSRLTQGGMMVGTVSYMPPEQAMGGEVTPSSDLYSLGAMLYEMVTGRPPFIGDESVAIITQHLNVPPVSPTWHRPDCPLALEALILRLLEKDPSKRPAAAAEVREALGRMNLSPSPFPAREGEPGPGIGDRSSVSPFPRWEGGREHRLVGPAGDNPMYRRTFVGREQELHQLETVFDVALSGQGALVAVVGEPGIGKTALCEQLATYVALRGGKALVGHSYEEGSLSLPYLPFVEALRSYVLAREPEQLRSELGTGAADVARIVSEVRDKVAVEPRAAGDPEDDRWRLYQGLTSFIRNAGSVQPLLLVLEDLHWADRGTLDYLVHLARNLQGARLLVVATYRDVEVDRTHPLSATLAELRRSSSFSRVLLRGLTVDEVQRMINAMQGQEVRWSFAEAVHRQTEGNPLFIQEVLRYLVEEGLIVRQGDHWEGRWRQTGETPPELAVPEGLRDVIGKRLSRLSPECNQMLAIASVIGRDFQLATLQAIADQPEETVLGGLEEALKVGVLEDRSLGGSVRFRFTHAFFRQTLYEELFTPRRLRLHQQVARALERLYAARLEEHAAELAEHFAQSSDADDLRKSVRYGELAAAKAMSVAAYGEAARLLQSALQAQEVLDPDDKARRCDLLLALGRALMPAGEPRHVLDAVAPEALTLAEALDDRPRASHVCTLAVESMERFAPGVVGFGTPEGRQWAEWAERYALPGTPDRVYTNIALGDALLAAHRWAEADAFYRPAMDLARQLGEPDALFAAAAKSLETARAEKLADLLSLVNEVAAQPREGAGARSLGLFLFRSAYVYLSWGERERAEQAWSELEALAARSHDANVLLRPLVVAIVRATLNGRLEEAIEAGTQLAVRAEELGSSRRGRGWANILTARPLLWLGRAQEALNRKPEPRPSALEANPAALAHRALYLAQLGRHGEATALLHQVLEDEHTGEGDVETPMVIVAVLLEIATVVGDQQAAAQLMSSLGPGTAILTYHPIGWGLTSIGRHVGAAAALLGEREQAMTYYEQALDVATRARFRPEIALTRLQIAELLLDEANSQQLSALSSQPSTPHGEAGKLTADKLKADSSEHLDFAIAEFRAMKMQPALERALRHKEVLKA